MENLGIFHEKILIDEETRDAINEEISKAYDLMSIDQSLSPSKIVMKIREYVDVLLSDESINSENLTAISVTIGALWGDSVCKEYNWTWIGLKEQGDEWPAFYVISPNCKCCIPAFGFINRILSNENMGLDNKNDNTVMLLFNMLDGVEGQFSDKFYQVLG